MGYTGALGMAQAASEGDVHLDRALGWHLQSNHYPPLPSFFIPTCKAAIEAAVDEDWDRELKLPLGCATHQVALDAGATEHEDGCEITNIVEWKDGRDVVRAGDLIESFHLEAFVESAFDDAVELDIPEDELL